MKDLLRNTFVLIVAIGLFSSCSEVGKKVDEKLNELKNKAVQIDSIVNTGVRKIKQLDTLLKSKTDKIHVIDSLINEESSKIDSIANEKIESFKKIIN